MSQIRQIFADVGAIDHLVATSNCTALKNFKTEANARKALSSLRPPPADNIQRQPYEERSRQPRTQRRAERSHNFEVPLSPTQTTVTSRAQTESAKRRATRDQTHNHSPSQPNPSSTSSTNRATKRRASSPSDASEPVEAAMEIDKPRSTICPKYEISPHRQDSNQPRATTPVQEEGGMMAPTLPFRASTHMKLHSSPAHLP